MTIAERTVKYITQHLKLTEVTSPWPKYCKFTHPGGATLWVRRRDGQVLNGPTLDSAIDVSARTHADMILWENR